MKILIIKAHPNPEGFTHKIADTYKASLSEQDEIKVIDLYNEQFTQDYLRLDLQNKPKEDPSRKMMQELITRADELVFIYPLRRGDVPAVLKNRIDTNLTH